MCVEERGYICCLALNSWLSPMYVGIEGTLLSTHISYIATPTRHPCQSLEFLRLSKSAPMHATSVAGSNYPAHCDGRIP